MEKQLGENWQTHYPAVLSKGEKADIKSALLKSLATGELTLARYLQNLKLISDYPEN